MAHGAPDDSDVVKQVDLYRVDDMAELAVRLGSIVTYRRTGQVMFLDTFEAGLACWEDSGGGLGSALTLQSSYARSCGVCPRLDVGMVAGGYELLTGSYPIWGDERVGIQFEVSIGNSIGCIYLSLDYYSPAHHILYRIRYNQAAQTLDYWNAAGAYTIIATGPQLRASPGFFHHIKVILDYDTHSYVRLLVNGTSYDLSGISAQVLAGFATSYVMLNLGVYSTALGAGYVLIDNIVLTRGED
jgi:hypothetical protein